MSENLSHGIEPAIEYPVPLDLASFVRGYMPPEGDRGSLSISSCPKNIAWSVESLSGRSGSSHAKTYACLLDLGMRHLWQFPGARDLQRAREKIIARGDPEPIRWVDSWEFDVPTSDTGETTPKVRVPVLGVLTPLGKLTTVLGFPKSKTAIIALMVALLDYDAVQDRYHRAQAELLRHFAAMLRDRADMASRYAIEELTSEAPPRPRYSLADIIGIRA
jgi:hypothetical protein